MSSIIAERRLDVETDRLKVPLEELRALAERRQRRSLIDSLANGQDTRLIAEMKKASPSLGLIREDYRPAEIAVEYQKAGAVGLSVLTEPRHFLGSSRHLMDARKAIDLPILRKDFISEQYHVYETAAIGADAILLIVAALEPELLAELNSLARQLGLDVLAETHTEAELEVALRLEGAIIGVNSRDLRTMRVNLDVARKLAPLIPKNRVAVAESGIAARAEIVELEKLGYSGFLVGETIMKAPNPTRKIEELRGKW